MSRRSSNQNKGLRWYADPQWAMAIATLLCGFFTLTITWRTGMLDSKATLVEIREYRLSSREDSLRISIGRSRENLSSVFKTIIAGLGKDDDSNLVDKLRSDPEFGTIFIEAQHAYCDSLERVPISKMMLAMEEIRQVERESEINLLSPSLHKKRP